MKHVVRLQHESTLFIGRAEHVFCPQLLIETAERFCPGPPTRSTSYAAVV
jgi:hypothetical protein